jgi:hypothetical protein
MLLAAVLVDAAHAALEDRKEAFRRIGMNVIANVFANAVLDGFMRGEMFLGTSVEAAFVGMQAAFLGDVFANDLGDVCLVSNCHMEGTDVTAALDQRNDGALVSRATLAALGKSATSRRLFANLRLLDWAIVGSDRLISQIFR